MQQNNILKKDQKEKNAENNKYIIHLICSFFNSYRIKLQIEIPFPPDNTDTNQSDELIRILEGSIKRFFPIDVPSYNLRIAGNSLFVTRRHISGVPMIYATNSVFPLSITGGIQNFEGWTSFKSRYLKRKAQKFTKYQVDHYVLSEKVKYEECEYIQFKHVCNDRILTSVLNYIPSFASHSGGIVVIGIDDNGICRGSKKSNQKVFLESFVTRLQQSPPLKLDENVFVKFIEISDELEIIEVTVDALNEFVPCGNVESYIFSNNDVISLKYPEYMSRLKESMCFKEEYENKAAISSWIDDKYPKICEMFDMGSSDCLTSLMIIFIDTSMWQFPSTKEALLKILWKSDNWFNNQKDTEMENFKRAGRHYLNSLLAFDDMITGTLIQSTYHTGVSSKDLVMNDFYVSHKIGEVALKSKLESAFCALIGCVWKYSTNPQKILKYLDLVREK